MKTTIFSLLILLSISITYQAQAQLQGQARIDSLLAELPKAKGDTNEVKLLNSLSFAFRGINPDKGIEYGEKALVLSEKFDWKKGIADAYNGLAINNANLGNFDKVLDYFKKSLEINQKIDNKSGVASSFNNIGNVYRHQSNFPKALESLQKALKGYEELDNKAGMVGPIGNIGAIYYAQGDYKKSLEYFQKGLKIYEELNNTSGISNALTNIADIYQMLSKYDESLVNYQKALSIKKEIGDRNQTARILNNIGLVYIKQEKFNKALEYFDESILINEEINNLLGLAQSKGLIAEAYLRQVINGRNTNFNDNNKIENLTSIGKLNKAIDYLLDAISIYKKLGNLADQSGTYQLLAGAYEEKGSYKKAYEAHIEYKKLQDSVFSLDKEKEIATLTAVREKEVTEKELVISQLENDQRKQESYVLYGGLALLAVVLFIIFRQRKKSEKLLLNILPVKIAKQLKKRKGNIADDIENASVTFIDLVGFTAYSKDKEASDVLEMLNLIFSKIDKLVIKHGLEKIKTMGDGYMAAAGVPEAQADHPVRITKFAFDVHRVLEESNKENNMNITARIGIECGPLVAGVIGDMKFIYDLWGDSVNTASRMESSGTPNKIHITENFKNELEKRTNEFEFSEPLELDIKGKGLMKTYYIEGKEVESV
ncbi:MAG: adenylate/guanylate cyclase domain-containing protein [Chlorobiota bacterium]